MTHEQKHAIVAILETLNEEREGGPESAIYMALGCDLDFWYELKAAMIANNLIAEEHNWVTIMPKGIEVVKKVAAVRAEHKQAKAAA